MTDQTIKRKPKKVIRRTDLAAAKLSTTKAPTKPKLKSKPKVAAPKKPGLTPSAIRLRNLDNDLCAAFEVWREFRPLAIGIEKEVFRHINDQQLSSSKRVTQRLLRHHVQDERYQRNLKAGGGRYHLGEGITEKQ